VSSNAASSRSDTWTAGAEATVDISVLATGVTGPDAGAGRCDIFTYMINEYKTNQGAMDTAHYLHRRDWFLVRFWFYYINRGFSSLVRFFVLYVV